jgi:hypothetical protein
MKIVVIMNGNVPGGYLRTDSLPFAILNKLSTEVQV